MQMIWKKESSELLRERFTRSSTGAFQTEHICGSYMPRSRGEGRTTRPEQRVLEVTVEFCPQAGVLRLMRTKKTWKTSGVERARAVLSRAFEANPQSQASWLAPAQSETEAGEIEKARDVLRWPASQARSAKVYLKSGTLGRAAARKKC
eukprot:GFKZ01001754.1.p1 GENE.GFKZ01001754.1~~GFKZ01001754.1.p1  ORF type:complete len:149 (+),score=16.07 GFKZ01001754.1:1162-1608(+)